MLELAQDWVIVMVIMSTIAVVIGLLRDRHNKIKQLKASDPWYRFNKKHYKKML